MNNIFILMTNIPNWTPLTYWKIYPISVYYSPGEGQEGQEATVVLFRGRQRETERGDRRCRRGHQGRCRLSQEQRGSRRLRRTCQSFRTFQVIGPQEQEQVSSHLINHTVLQSPVL